MTFYLANYFDSLFLKAILNCETMLLISIEKNFILSVFKKIQWTIKLRFVLGKIFYFLKIFMKRIKE